MPEVREREAVAPPVPEQDENQAISCGVGAYRIRLLVSAGSGWGYKVIDPDAEVATKEFDDDVDDELVRKEIEQHRYIGQYEFAPSMKFWSVEERWYQEDYLYGKTGYYFSPESSRELKRIY